MNINENENAQAAAEITNKGNFKVATIAGICSIIAAILGAILGRSTVSVNVNINGKSVKVEDSQIQKVYDEKESLEQKVEKLIASNNSLEKEKEDLKNLSSGQQDLENSIVAKNKEIESLQGTISDQKNDLDSKTNEIASLNTHISNLQTKLAEFGYSPISETNNTGKKYLTNLDYFTKNGTIVKENDTLDNLKINRTNVIGSGTSSAYTSYVYKRPGDCKRLKGTFFLSYEKRSVSYSGIIRIYLDNSKVKDIKLMSGNDPVQFDVDISNCSEIKIEFNGSKNGFYLSDVYFE